MTGKTHHFRVKVAVTFPVRCRRAVGVLNDTQGFVVVLGECEAKSID